MCYHTSVPDRTEIDDLYDHAVRTDEWDKYYNHLSGFSFSKVPVLTMEKPDSIQPFNWGLIPSWTKAFEDAKKARMNCLNAKGETVFEKPSFRTSIIKKRCLIFTNGFFEWRDFNKKKYPYFIFLKEQKTFAFGGIYENWVDKETGEIFNTTSIITTEANPLMAKIHNLKLRMPLIFDKENMMNWIKPTLTKEEIGKMITIFPEEKMEAYTISKLITSRTEDSNQKRVKEKFEYPELRMQI